MRAKRIYRTLARLSTLCAAAALLFLSATARAQVVQQAVGTPAVQPQTEQFEIGPTLDVVPVVLADGYTINLTLIPVLLEFDGYDTPPVVPGIAGVVQVPTSLPKFTARSVVTTVNVWDNQTVSLGGLISSSVQSTKDKVPFLGDLPLFGRLFQSQSKTTQKKNLMIFVTATIIDPAGNRLHSDDELPFNPMTIPPQPNGAAVFPQTNGVTFVASPASNVTDRRVMPQPVNAAAAP
jgi:type II secretory pathway component GspD/PulD (secretin)